MDKCLVNNCDQVAVSFAGYCQYHTPVSDTVDNRTERLIEIPESEYAALRESQRVVEAMEGVWKYAHDNGLTLFGEEKHAGRCQLLLCTFGLIIDGKIDKKVDDVVDFSAAILKLWDRLKPNNEGGSQ